MVAYKVANGLVALVVFIVGLTIPLSPRMALARETGRAPAGKKPEPLEDRSRSVPKERPGDNFAFAQTCILEGKLELAGKHIARACVADPGCRQYVSFLAVDGDQLGLSSSWGVLVSGGPNAQDVAWGVGAGLGQSVLIMPEGDPSQIERYVSRLSLEGGIYVKIGTLSNKDEPVKPGDPQYREKTARNLQRAMARYFQGLALPLDNVGGSDLTGLSPEERSRVLGSVLYSDLIFQGFAVARRRGAWAVRITTKESSALGFGWTKLKSPENLNAKAARLLGERLGCALAESMPSETGRNPGATRSLDELRVGMDAGDEEIARHLAVAHTQPKRRLQALTSLARGTDLRRASVLGALQRAAPLLDAQERPQSQRLFRASGTPATDSSWAYCVAEASKLLK